jgi:hypothetical protein
VIAHWSSSGFGTLNTSDAIRVVIPGATATILGFEIVLASFFLSILGLARK